MLASKATLVRGSAARCEGRPVTGLLAVQHGLAQRLVFSKLKPAVGLGRARVCVSGAAPIAAEVLAFFASLDVIAASTAAFAARAAMIAGAKAESD